MNTKLIRKRSKKTGLPPGALVHIGDKKTEPVKISVIDYDENQFRELDAKSVEDCFPFKDTPTVTWINIDGIHNVDVVEKIGMHFNIHPLVLEDIVTPGQLPKMEDAEEYLFIVLKMLTYSEKDIELTTEQVSLLVGKNYVISFQESKEGDVFDPIRERIRTAKVRMRKLGPDYLAYSLMDAVIDNYFIILEKIGEKIESLEEELLAGPSSAHIKQIHTLKRDLLFLRKSVWPLREVVSCMEKGDTALVHESTEIYLRDLYDHIIQVMDTIETFRDMVSGILDLYLSSTSNKLNEVMKVLTIIATLFIPLTFVVGVYGMNFDYMPELKSKWGYPLIWAAMLLIAGGMLMYFKKRKWL